MFLVSKSKLGCVLFKIKESLKSNNRLLFCYYNIPRACLHNRSTVPAIDLKSNKSGLWHHMLETCRNLR